MGLLWIANSNDCVFDVLDVRMTSKYLTLFICTHKYWIEVSRLLQCQSHWLKKCFTKIWELFGCLLGVCFGYEALTLIPIVLSWLMKFPIPASFLSFVLSQKLRISICLSDAVGSNLSDGWFFLIPCDSIGIFHFGHVIDHPCVFQGQCWRHACLASKGLKMMLGFTSFPLA